MEVTRQINARLDVALQEKDRIAVGMLNWFVGEQLEEVSSMEGLLGVIRRAGPNGLLFVEDSLARQGAKS
jgi:ferritin